MAPVSTTVPPSLKLPTPLPVDGRPTCWVASVDVGTGVASAEPLPPLPVGVAARSKVKVRVRAGDDASPPSWMPPWRRKSSPEASQRRVIVPSRTWNSKSSSAFVPPTLAARWT